MKGIYLLQINLPKNIEVQVGALGKRTFKKGNYVYVGSAQNGVEQRVNRHLRKNKKLHWHIDYLLSNPAATITGAYTSEGNKKEECEAARQIGAQAEPVAGFGCSDCQCKSHLFFLGSCGFEDLETEPAPTKFKKSSLLAEEQV